MKVRLVLLFSGLLLSGPLSYAAPLGTAFTYQGRLDQNGQPANGTYQMKFELYTDPAAGTFLGSNGVFVVVSNGLFTVDLDFGPLAFLGQERWLQTLVRTNGASADVTLSPRTRVAPTPNAIYASTAGTVTNGAIRLGQLGTAGAPPVAGQLLSYDGAALVWENPAAASGAWVTGGNSILAGNFLGTVNSLPLELRANNVRALRLEPNPTSPNLIGGWNGNFADAGVSGATISGGGAALQAGMSASNRVADHFGTIGGGAHNLAGDANGSLVDAYYATVGGGHFNVAVGIASTIAGGAENHAANNNSSIGGGYLNVAAGYISTIGGGQGNVIVTAGSHSVIGGGNANSCGSNAAFVGGGSLNHADGSSSTLAGGYDNTVSGEVSFIGGGARNRVTSRFSTASGGENNTVSGDYSTVGGGVLNVASGAGVTIGGGNGNFADGGGLGQATVGGGSGNQARGAYATVPGGALNVAQGSYSFAAGIRAKALHHGSFVWSDASGGVDVTSVVANEFVARASGGVAFFTSANLSTGVKVDPGGNAWSPTSDRNVKENFKPIDVRSVLAKVSEMPITEWNLKTQEPSIRHFGPMAQDFRAAFGLGCDDRHISTSDADGVALAAIQGLHQLVQEQRTDLDKKEARIAELEKQTAKTNSLEERVKRLERLLEESPSGIDGAPLKAW